MHARVADGGDLDVLEALGVDGVEAEEVKNRLASMPSARAPLAMISPG